MYCYVIDIIYTNFCWIKIVWNECLLVRNDIKSSTMRCSDQKSLNGRKVNKKYFKSIERSICDYFGLQLGSLFYIYTKQVPTRLYLLEYYFLSFFNFKRLKTRSIRNDRNEKWYFNSYWIFELYITYLKLNILIKPW